MSDKTNSFEETINFLVLHFCLYHVKWFQINIIYLYLSRNSFLYDGESYVMYEVHTISFQTFFVWAFKIIVDSWNFSMLLLYIVWDDNFYDFRFKWTATAGIGIHTTKAWLKKLMNFKNAIWTWGRTIHQSWLAKGLGLGLLSWGFKGVQKEIPSEETSTLQIESVAWVSRVYCQ